MIYVVKHAETDEFVCNGNPERIVYSDRLSEAKYFTGHDAAEYMRSLAKYKLRDLHVTSYLSTQIENLERELTS